MIKYNRLNTKNIVLIVIGAFLLVRVFFVGILSRYNKVISNKDESLKKRYESYLPERFKLNYDDNNLPEIIKDIRADESVL